MPVKSSTEEWETPDKLFNELDQEFNFDIDVAASPTNTKCKKYYTKKDNALKQDWNGSVWLNPPYAAKSLSSFVKKMLHELSMSRAKVVVMLAPVKTDQEWWHILWDHYLYGDFEIEYRWIKGRLNSTFPSVVIVVR